MRVRRLPVPGERHAYQAGLGRWLEQGPRVARRWVVSITDRDKKIISLLVPILLVAGFFYFVLAPKRHEAGKVQEELTQAQTHRDTAQAQATQLTSATN